MPETAQAQGAASRNEAVQITAVSGRRLLRLKCWLAGSATGGKPVAIAGQVLPSQVGATASESVHVLCVGPGDWLIVSEQLDPFVRERVESDAEQQGIAIVELTDGLATVDVRGPGVRDLLSKGCGLDWHQRYFPTVVIESLDEPPRFELTVARSYSRYLHAWLTDATAKF
jgi:sarcosine oxidase subunit gamma